MSKWRNFFFLAVHAACVILVTGQGSNLHPLQWKRRVLTTGPPGKSLSEGVDLRNNNNLSTVIEKAEYTGTTASKLEDLLIGRRGTSLLTTLISMKLAGSLVKRRSREKRFE